MYSEITFYYRVSICENINVSQQKSWKRQNINMTPAQKLSYEIQGQEILDKVSARLEGDKDNSNPGIP